MRNSLKERIRHLIPSLPEKDMKLFNTFLEERDYQSMLDIVDSNLYKEKRSKNPSEKYMSSLVELSAEITDYMSYTDDVILYKHSY